MAFYELIFFLFGLTAISWALPASLLEDIKDAQIQSPIRATNKVKRAQEFIMFGNQQNRASNNFGNNKNEKRGTVYAPELDDNSLADDEVPLPNVVPQFDEHNYDSNQLGSGKEFDRAYPHFSRDLYYNMLLRNLELTQALHNEPAFNLDLPFYNIMDSRAKREVNKKSSPKQNLRMKRDYPLSTEDLLTFMKMWEAEKANRKAAESRNHPGRFPVYETESDDYIDADDDNLLPFLASDENGSWYDGPVYNTHSQRERDIPWHKPHKRFMVSKRQDSGSNFQLNSNSFSDYSNSMPLHRRFVL